MKKKIIYIAILIAVYLWLLLDYKMTYEQTGYLTLSIGFIIIFALEVILGTYKQYKTRKKEKADREENTRYTQYIEQGVEEYKTLSQDLEAKLTNEIGINTSQAKELDNYNKMFEQLKRQINLGDTVTTTNYHKPRKVTAMKLIEEGKDGRGRAITKIQYQLGTTKKWYSKEQLRKVADTN